MHSQVGIGGNIHVIARNVITGEVRESHASNLVPTVGLNYHRDLMAGGAFKPNQIAAGTGQLDTVEGTVALASEVIRRPISRRDGTISKKIVFRAFVPASVGGTHTYHEIGLFENATLIGRGVLETGIDKNPSIEVTLVYELTYSALT